MSPLSPSSPRRRLLQAAAASLGLGAVGGYTVGAGRFLRDTSTCNPSERHTDPADWPAPRYDLAGTGRAPERNAPHGDLEEEWRVGYHADRIGQPVISGGRAAVVIAESSSSERVWTVDLASGEERWRTLVTRDGHMGGVGALVASEGELFYQTDTEEHGRTVIAISLGSGRRSWVGPSETGVYGRPAVTDRGRVWLPDRDADSDESIVRSRSADTGHECSSWRLDGARGGDIYVRGGSLYLSTDEGIVALDRETGEQRWRTDESARLRAVGENRVFATNHPGFLTAYRRDSGERDWTVESDHYVSGEPLPENPHFKRTGDGNSVARPNYRDLAIVDDLLLTRESVYSSHADRITALEIETGAEAWRVAPDDPTPENTRTWYTGPVVAGSTAFVCENRGDGTSKLVRVDVSAGEIREGVEMATHAVATPAVGQGAVVVPEDGGLACYTDGR